MGMEYLAGFFDADGHVGMTKNGVELIVAGQVRSPLLRFQAEFGGSIYEDWGRYQKRGSYAFFTWRCPAVAKERMISSLLPHMTVKGPQAWEALRFLQEGKPRGQERQGYVKSIRRLKNDAREPLMALLGAS